MGTKNSSFVYRLVAFMMPFTLVAPENNFDYYPSPHNAHKKVVSKLFHFTFSSSHNSH